MSPTTGRARRWAYLAIGVVAVITMGFGTITVWNHVAPATRVTAHFERVSGLYTDDEVRILGVKVGKVTDVEPRGDEVVVTFEFDGNRKVPADAMAAIVAPALVSGRYIQIAPAYTGGPQLIDGADIPVERTAVPVEWDQIKDELTTLTDALGPQGSDQAGSLARFVDSAAAGFEGNGQSLRETISALHDAAATIGRNSTNLFATVDNLNKFIRAMNQSDAQIQTLTSQLASIAALLNDNRGRMAEALTQLDEALRAVSDFVLQNKDRIQSSVGQLSDVATMVQENQTALANVLHSLPITLANFYNIYDPNSHSFTGRIALPHFGDVPTFVCQTVFSLGGTLDDCRASLDPYLKQFDNPNLPLGFNILNRPGTTDQAAAGAATVPVPGTPPITTGALGSLFGISGGPK
ncbi:MCE family protein (plasmid) [Rhodococcus sp. USK10]|uniref:MCE family protein n=1 Tax=Rhodococcus sp. USK10 TaxID=2789739 RepID=UPI001C5ECE28|nr:MCE family protein [Rhodococcus sp. USK10]QYA99845.1 MCE family protein [Rhodococcus sp. USK10]